MKKRILFVEDDIATIDVYKIALESAGFDVDPMLLGGEAIRRIEEIDKGEAEKPDLVLLDLLEVLEEIRKRENTKNMPVLILTNYSSKELETRGLLLKAEKYLLKTDYPPSKLVEFIKKEFK